MSVLASAYFILFAVGSMKSAGAPISMGKHGSTGGYALIAEFDIPLPYHIGVEKGRRYLAIKDPDDALWNRVTVTAMRSSSGEDVSCRNLYRPSAPKVLSVPEEMIAEEPFSFAGSVERTDNPWRLLDVESSAGVPVIADADAAQWILHKKLGDTLSIRDGGGRERALRLVALLRQSMFQAEVLMGEKVFLSLFPGKSGYQTLLVKASTEDARRVKDIILRDLSDFGATVETTRERIASFSRIADSYISAFEMLGGLGRRHRIGDPGHGAAVGEESGPVQRGLVGDGDCDDRRVAVGVCLHRGRDYPPRHTVLAATGVGRSRRLCSAQALGYNI
jgi:hypothetical protein